MIRSLLGRFFRHCIGLSEQRERRVIMRQLDAQFMTDMEISLFLRGKAEAIDWEAVNVRRIRGEILRPGAAS